jgi:hypothetical protein
MHIAISIALSHASAVIMLMVSHQGEELCLLLIMVNYACR